MDERENRGGELLNADVNPTRSVVAKVALVVSVVALAIAIPGLVVVVGDPCLCPPGEKGEQGDPGPQGEQGPQGDPGPAGANGSDGEDGISCWDLNGNGVEDPSEDVNGDLVVDANDCRGAQGDPGPQGLPGADGADGADGVDGINCWDLNENGVEDPAEDVNGDLVVDVNDCKGPQGDPGPPGPGTLMTWDTSGATTTIETTCTNYAGAAVTITVPSDGLIVVSGQAWLLIDHTVGTEDRWYVGIGDAPTDCSETYGAWVGSISVNSATDSSLDRTGPVTRVFMVAPGTYTYYLNGMMWSGQSSTDRFWYAIQVAVFYPS
jgi:hypothetical protein